MTFDMWCRQEFGLIDFMEGKIPNSVFLPALPSARVIVNETIAKAGGYSIDTPYLRGLIIPYDGFQILKANFFQHYYSATPNKSDADYQEWIKHHFYLLGVDLASESEYKEPANIHFTFATEAHRLHFFNAFSYISPIPSFNPLSGKHTLQLSATVINYLKQLYYQSQSSISNTPQHFMDLHQQIAQLKQLKAEISVQQLSHHLDYANILSRDYSNNRRNSSEFYDYHAASAYALSLKVYAEINQDNLSKDDYESLLSVSSLLAAYNESGNLEQSLKTDAYYASSLARKFYASFTRYTADGNFVIPVLGSFPEHVQDQIQTMIQKNITNMLSGNEAVSLGKGVNFRMKRFLPDEQMRSETDELIFQGGGMRNHSALFRIIKVGYLADGSKASPHQKPLYFKYYKVVDNLGVGCQGIDQENKTCLGTFVTQLSPFSDGGNKLLVSSIKDPATDPVRYQQEMEFTLRMLIAVERQLLFYRMPGSESNISSPYGSDEANEWLRLNEINTLLSGNFEANEIEYCSTDPLDNTKRSLRIVRNQRNYMQEGGSCLIFALKSLVSSVIGTYLTTLHNNFMQLNNAQGHINAIDLKLMELGKLVAQNALQEEAEKAAQEAAQVRLQLQSQKQRFFFGNNEYGLQILKNAALDGALNIVSAVVMEDHLNKDKHFILIESENEEQTIRLAKSIAELKITNPKMFAMGNKLILDEQSLMSFCQSLKISYATLMQSLPLASESQMRSPY